MQNIQILSNKYLIGHDGRVGLLFDVENVNIFSLPIDTAVQLEQEVVKYLNDEEKSKKMVEEITILLEECKKNGGKKYFNRSYHFSEKTSGEINKLMIVLNNSCNLKCRYCYAQSGTYGRKEKYMTPENAKEYIDALIKQGINGFKIINFFGGEPLLNIDTLEFICKYMDEMVKKRLILNAPKYTIITNGTILSEKILENLIKYNIVVTVSLDGEKKINDLCRVGNNIDSVYDLAINNMRIMKEKGVKLKLVEATYTKFHEQYGYTRKDISKFISNKVGVNEVFIGDCSGEYKPIKQREVFDSSKEREDLLRIKYIVNEKSKVNNATTLCDAGVRSVLIDSYGSIYPCQYFLNDTSFCIAQFEKNNKNFKYLGSKKFENINNKDKRTECRMCWARKICKSCTYAFYSNSIDENMKNCNCRRDRYGKILFDICESSKKSENRLER